MRGSQYQPVALIAYCNSRAVLSVFILISGCYKRVLALAPLPPIPALRLHETTLGNFIWTIIKERYDHHRKTYKVWISWTALKSFNTDYTWVLQHFCVKTWSQSNSCQLRNVIDNVVCVGAARCRSSICYWSTEANRKRKWWDYLQQHLLPSFLHGEQARAVFGIVQATWAMIVNYSCLTASKVNLRSATLW